MSSVRQPSKRIEIEMPWRLGPRRVTELAASHSLHRSRVIPMVTMLIDGWSVRSVKDPALTKQGYLSALRPMFENLLRCDREGGC